MSTRSGIVGLVAGSFLAMIILPGCGGGSPTTGDTAAVEAPKSEVEYQKQQEQLRKDNLSRAKSGASKAARR